VEFQDIIYEKRAGIAIIRLNRPHKLNACTLNTYAELRAAVQDADRDEDVRASVITGEGRGFCAGDDVQEIFLASPPAGRGPSIRERLEELRGQGQRGIDNLLFFDKPAVAAVNGPAVGYGFDLALMCDVRIAAESARFGSIFVRRGLMADAASLLLLPRIVGWSKAAELTLTGDIIDAQEALRIGLVSKVVPQESLMDEAIPLARRMADNAPLAVRMTKHGLRRSLGLDLRPFLEWQSVCQGLLMRSEDHREGARAFVEKREPRFQGR
jgi:enoyl-CoA hydratase/carnithine racemase